MSRICSVSAFCWSLLAHLGPDLPLTAQNRLRTSLFGLLDTPVSTKKIIIFHFLFLFERLRRLWFFSDLSVLSGFQCFSVFFSVFSVFQCFQCSFYCVSSWPALASPGRPWQATAGPGRLRQALAGLSLYVRVRSAPACPSQPSTGPNAAIRAIRA